MTLDKQRILNELGNVMSQLQNADCGCMSKVFGNPGQELATPMAGGTGDMAAMCTNRHGCCHGYGHRCGGSVYSEPCTNRRGLPCMGHCDPVKLYTDTYNYLNKNLMQPTVAEVSNDLNSIMGSGNKPSGNPAVMPVGQHPMTGGGGMPMGENGMSGGGMMGNTNAMQNMGGMSPETNMMAMNNQGMKQMPNNGMGMRYNQNGLSGVGGMPVGQGDMSGGGMGNTMPATGMMPNSGMQNPGMLNSGGMPNMGGHAPGYAMPMDRPEPTQPNDRQYPGMGKKIMNMMMQTRIPKLTDINAQMGFVKDEMDDNLPQTPQGVQNPMSGMPPSGQYRGEYMKGPSMGAGMQNQNGVQNMGGMPADGRTPMGAGMQNPTAMYNTGAVHANGLTTGANMQNPGNRLPPMGTGMQNPNMNQNTGRLPSTGFPPTGVEMQNPNAMQNISGMPATGMSPTAAGMQNPNAVQNMGGNSGVVPLNMNTPQATQRYESMPTDPNYQNQQMAPATGTTGPPAANALNNQQVYYQYNQQGQQFQQGEQIQQSNTTGQELQQGQPINQSMPPEEQQNQQEPNANFIMDPIFPVNSENHPYHDSRAAYYQYLQREAQLQSLPSNIRSIPTRSKLGVKGTLSKTSIMGNGSIKKASSKAQLQQIYQQYKGSQSFTDQGLRTPIQNGTLSEGRLTTTPANPNMQIPIEKVAGDTSANNQVVNKVEPNQGRGQIGDVPPANKPQGDNNVKVSPVGKPFRNGLQDMVYTSYPSNAAWSFHGDYPTSPTYRYRVR